MFELKEGSLLSRSGLNLRIRMRFGYLYWNFISHVAYFENIFISRHALRAWSRILLLEGIVKGLPVLMETPWWSVIRVSRWRESLANIRGRTLFTGKFIDHTALKATRNTVFEMEKK